MNKPGMMEKYILLLARLLIGAMFMASVGVLVGQFGRVVGLMAAKGIPLATPLLVIVVFLWLFGALSIVSGYRIREASICLFVVLIPITISIHGPWNADAAHFQNELNNFLKNLAIMGGLLYLATFGPGPLSLGEPSGGNRTRH